MSQRGNMHLFGNYTVVLMMLLALQLFGQAQNPWQDDFQYQPVSQRPCLEVNYTDASRRAFQVLAESYQLTGQLTKPHILSDTNTGLPWLWFEMQDETGVVYSTQYGKGKSRINLDILNVSQ